MHATLQETPLAPSTPTSPETGNVGVSVVIPVHNAVATLEATLNSLVLQSYPFWEAIVINDGSTDATCTIAERWAQRDGRIRVLHQAKLGVSAARNRGLQEARYSFVLFLDGDDRIAPAHLERMVGKLSSDCTLDAVHCGWQNVLPSGASARAHHGSGEGDLFQYFAAHCHFAIHACILRRDLALAVGGFDVSLATCEDWDFFQRVARTGARFGRVPEVLAFYHMRADSASRDGRRCVTDARIVLERGHARDPRLRIASKAHLEGEPSPGMDIAFYHIVIYWAAQEIGLGRDGSNLLDLHDLSIAPGLQPGVVAEIIHEQIPLGANRPEEEWPNLWNQVGIPLAAFLIKLESKSGVPRLAFIALRHLEKRILLADPSEVPLLLGGTYGLNIDLEKSIRDVFVPTQADRVICRLKIKGEPSGLLELPAAEVLAGRKIAEAALEGRPRSLFSRILTPQRAVSLGLRAMRLLLRPRMGGLIFRALAAKPDDRFERMRRAKHEAAVVIRTNFPKIVAPPPGVAARQADQKWRQSVEAALAAGRAEVREQIRPPETHDWRDRFFAVPDSRAYDMTPAAYGLARLPGRPSAVPKQACSVPILMYHRIAGDGAASLTRFRTAPELFTAQIASLHRAGYRTIRLEQWIEAIRRDEPMPGQPIILTFDDGYQDFLTAAMPVLRHYGFSATVFLVAKRIGGVAEWDSHFGAAAPLLSWNDVRVLQEEGIEFGCHSATHLPMIGMHLAELTEQTARARGILEEGLAAPVTALAYPYGAQNEFVRRVVADLRFQAAVTCQPGISRLGNDLLQLPRIEVFGGCTPEQLLAMIDDVSDKHLSDAVPA